MRINSFFICFRRQYEVVLTKKAAQKLGGILSRRCISAGVRSHLNGLKHQCCNVFSVLKFLVGGSLHLRPQRLQVTFVRMTC